MTKIDELASNLDPKKRTIKRDEFYGFIKESLHQIGGINETYKKLYEDSEERPAILKSIEEKYDKIKANYDDLFLANEQGVIKSTELQNKINEVRDYHKGLIEGSGEKNSIKADIEDSQKHITGFYNFLFDKEEGKKSNEEKSKKHIKKINQFYKELSNKEDGIKKEIEEIYKAITQKHSDLFEAEEGKSSKVEELESNIANIQTFNKSLDEEIKVNLKEKQEYLGDVKIDIETTRKDIKSLLSSATLKTLTQGYQESKEEYSAKKAKEYKKLEFKKNPVILFYNISIFFFNVLFRHLVALLNYIVFIFPLFIILVLFVQPEWKVLTNFNEFLKNLNGSDFENYIFFRMALSLPLVWISWFGQRNISQRKRLHEEYNHKLRVVQMYRMFNDDNESYSLDNKVKLEKILLEVIEKNPGVYLGRGETIIDQILEKFKIKGFYKELKQEIVEELKPVIKTTLKNINRNSTNKKQL
ncbi:hypothetical protein KJ830_11110 [bacterium]|nr:hypothetical protein [bacterium]